MSTSIKIEVTVNGEAYSEEVPTNLSLLNFLRYHLGLTGTKEGCSEGECGACSVIVNERLIDSCLVFAAEVNGQNVATIEGLGQQKLHPLQKAFAQYGAAQCGYCTPGMLMAAKFLLDQNTDPNKQEILTAIAGNLCRCTGYSTIVKAVSEAARES